MRFVTSHRRGRFRLGEHVEEVVLAGGPIAGLGRCAGHGAVNTIEDGLAGFAGEIESPGFGQMFEHAFVGAFAIHSSHEVVEVFEGAVGFAFFDDFDRGGFTHAFDAGEAKTDFAAAAAAALRRNVQC